jgi:hypothetical protein
MTDLITLPRATVQQALHVATAAGYPVALIAAIKAALEQPVPPPEAQTEVEKIAYCAGWWAGMEQKREQPARPLCKGIPRRGCNYLAPCDTVCNKCGEIHHHHQMVAQFQAAQQPEQEQATVKESLTTGEQPEQEPDRWGAGYEAGYAAGMAEMKPGQEPVAWQYKKDGGGVFVSDQCLADVEVWNDIEWSKPLYTHPPRRKPLSDEELDRLWREPMSADWEHREFARAIEAAHGIKEN